jgi:GNAT superfamily N-acetyltransferase
MTIEAVLPRATFRPTTVGDAASRYRGAVDEVIDLDGLSVGHILVAPIAGLPGGWTVVDLFVRPAHRGRGAGTAALLRWVGIAHEQGGPLSVTRPADDPYRDYFLRLGFRMIPAIGAREVRYVNDQEPAW